MIAFLQRNTDKLKAWAAAQGISPNDVPGYIARLTDVILQFDTRVTNHGYRDGVAYPIDEVLQRGTAVLIDEFGIPRARCYCGNPLTPARKLAKTVTIVLGGGLKKPWPGFCGRQDGRPGEGQEDPRARADRRRHGHDRDLPQAGHAPVGRDPDTPDHPGDHRVDAGDAGDRDDDTAASDVPAPRRPLHHRPPRRRRRPPRPRRPRRRST